VYGKYICCYKSTSHIKDIIIDTVMDIIFLPCFWIVVMKPLDSTVHGHRLCISRNHSRWNGRIIYIDNYIKIVNACVCEGQHASHVATATATATATAMMLLLLLLLACCYWFAYAVQKITLLLFAYICILGVHI
jgi:hypothetical protein